MRILTNVEPRRTDDNPYLSLLNDELRREGVAIDGVSGRRLLSRPEVLHVHWPEQLLRHDDARTMAYSAAKLLLLIAAARLRGTVVVWTAHNLRPHERRHPRLSDAFMALFTAQVDLVIGLTAGSRAAVVARYPLLKRRPFVVVSHGHYRDAYPRDERDKAASRRRLGLPANARTLLTLGYVRRYKNLPALVRAFTRGGRDDARLVIVGPLGEEALGDEIQTARGDDERIVLRLATATPEEVVGWHAAADVVVLPYDTSSSLNSGAALLALSFDRPVVMPDGPAAAELRGQVGAEWVRPVRGAAPDFLDAALEMPLPTHAQPALEHLDWDRLGRATLAAYEQARRRRRWWRRLSG